MAETMFLSDDSMKLFKNCPAVFQEVLIQFRVCKEILEPDTLNKVDQCAVDFRHMLIQTASLSDKMSSIWCKTCLLFFKNLEKINTKRVDIMLKQISSQARDLSAGFKTIGNWCRELVRRFHVAVVQSVNAAKALFEIKDKLKQEKAKVRYN